MKSYRLPSNKLFIPLLKINALKQISILRQIDTLKQTDKNAATNILSKSTNNGSCLLTMMTSTIAFAVMSAVATSSYAALPYVQPFDEGLVTQSLSNQPTPNSPDDHDNPDNNDDSNNSNTALNPVNQIHKNSSVMNVADNVKVVTIEPTDYDEENQENIERTELIDQLFINNDPAQDNPSGDEEASTSVPLNQVSPDTLKTFVGVIDIVRKQYIEPVDDEKLFSYAMQGMLKNLDAHAEFLDAQRYANLQAFTQGDLAEIGIDATFDTEQGNWVVQRVVPSSPADLAGVKAGFYLHQINDRKLNEHTRAHDVKQLLQGFAGSMVDIVVSNAGRRARKLTLQRTLSTITSVKVKLDRGIAIVQIPNFQENTRQEILDALVELNAPIYGVILDVRDNPGGVLGSAVDVAGLFISDAEVVQVENRQGEIQILSTHGKAYLADIPVMILQNRYSASASEVLASSLQYNKRATIIGETSYGKGTVQSVIPIDNGQAVKLTVADYLRPNGSQIDGQGVRPDITLVSETHEKFYDNLFSIVGQTTAKASYDNLQQLNLASVSSDTRAKISNEIQWQKQAVNILLEQIDYQYRNASASMQDSIKHAKKHHRSIGFFFNNSKKEPKEPSPDNNSSNLAPAILLVYPEEAVEEGDILQDNESPTLSKSIYK